MPFLARIDFTKTRPRVRAYLHSAGISPVYAPFGSSIDIAAASARDHLIGLLETQVDLLGSFDFALAAVYGRRVREDGGAGKPDKYRNVNLVDLFGYRCRDTWHDNTDFHAFVYQDGLWIRTDSSCATTCGDTLIVLGREEEHRRTTPDLDTYLRNPPVIPGLERIFVLSDVV